MDSNKFKQFCESIDYDTSGKIRNILAISAIGLSLTRNLTSQYPILDSSVDVLGFLSCAAFLGFNVLHGVQYDLEHILPYSIIIDQIEDLYQEFLINYNKLNKIFDLNNPIEIYTMFNFLLRDGYLSVDKKFEFSKEALKSSSILDGPIVITGKAVCRHTCGMLTDILNSYGIESYNLGVCTKKGVALKFKIKDIMERILGNHVITFAVSDENSYYLDPTKKQIYRLRENEKNILYNDIYDNISIKLLSLDILNDEMFCSIIKEQLSQKYPSVTREEEEKMIEQTIDKYNGNMDVFEQFYNDNRELYKDISSKVLTITK